MKKNQSDLTYSFSAWLLLKACFPGSWGSSESPPDEQDGHITLPGTHLSRQHAGSSVKPCRTI